MSEEKMREALPCPFCGGHVDPDGWLDGNGKRGPECWECGATAESMDVWNSRAALQESEAGTVAKVVRNSAGQIVMQNGEGGYFDISQYVGESFYLAPPSAQAIETAAIMRVLKEVEECEQYPAGYVRRNVKASDIIRALIPQDGRTQLEEFGMNVAEAATDSARSYSHEVPKYYESDLLAIVTDVIGEKK